MFFNYKYLTCNNPFTVIYGLSRTFLASSLLITLIFSSNDVLFDKTLFNLYSIDCFLNKINLYFIIGYNNLFISKIISLIILVCVFSGYYPRYTGILHWWVTFSFLHASSIIDGGDQIASIATFLLIPVTLCDRRKNHWNKISDKGNWFFNSIGNLFLGLIRIQVSVLYLHAAIEKIYKVDEWVDGSAIYYFFSDPLFGYPDWMDFFLGDFIKSKWVFFISWATIIFELLLSGSLFMSRRNRRVMFFLAVFFHFFIAIVFGLFSFFLSMLGVLIIYLIPYDLNLSRLWKTILSEKRNFFQWAGK